MSAILTVFRKEMKDHLRDRRSILIAMIYPLMGPLLLGLMFAFVGGGMRVNEGAPLVVPVVNAESAPDLVGYLERQGATIEPLQGNVWAMVSGGWLSFALVLPDRPPFERTGSAPGAADLQPGEIRQYRRDRPRHRAPERVSARDGAQRA